MTSAVRNSKTEIVVAALAIVFLLERAIRGIFFAEASSFVYRNSTARLFIGEPAVLMGLLYLGLAGFFVGYLLRFNRWKGLLYIGVFFSWLGKVCKTPSTREADVGGGS